ncbi:helix-turn-helix transcriptional regulator [Methylorubrum populi]
MSAIEKGLRSGQLLTTEEVAHRLRVAAATVTWWRSQKQGPAFIRLGVGKRAPVRYRTEAIDLYISTMEIATEKQ